MKWVYLPVCGVTFLAVAKSISITISIIYIIIFLLFNVTGFNMFQTILTYILFLSFLFFFVFLLIFIDLCIFSNIRIPIFFSLQFCGCGCEFVFILSSILF